jgi:two-component system OmpR family response regulator
MRDKRRVHATGMIANHHGLPGPASYVPHENAFATNETGRPDGARIVVVDDDPGLRDLLTEFLIDHGLQAEAVDSGAALRTLLQRSSCDLVVLDMMMPGEDGLSVLRTLVQDVAAPAVIMFSALGSEVDRVVALEMGADDYVTKPSSPREILARIRSVLRRRGTRPATVEASHVADGAHSGSCDIFAFAGWTLDCRMRVLHAPDGAVVRLTDGEYLLLHAFVSEPQTVHSRDDMIARSGRTESMARGRTIDVNISRLRRKLLAFDPTEIIRTVRGNGYVFMPTVVPR